MRAKEIYNKIGNVVQKAVYSDLCTLGVCVVVYLCWLLDWTAVALIFLTAFSCVALLFAKDLSSLFLPLIVCLTGVKNPSDVTTTLLVCLLVPLGLSGAAFVVRNRPKKVLLGQMFVPQTAVSFALLIGGVGVVSTQNYLHELPLVLALGVGMLALYFVFVNFSGRNSSVDVPAHFAKICVYVGFVVCAELATVILQSGLSPSEWSSSYWDLGWGNRGMAATFIPFAIVMSLFLCVREKKYPFVFLLVSFVQLACLMMTLSRAATLFGLIAFVAALVTCLVLGKRKQLLVCCGAVLGVVLLTCAVFHEKVSELALGIWDRFSQIKIYFENGKLVIEGTSGRFGEDALYGQAVQMFKQHPIFGVGMGGHPNVAISVSEAAEARFHSTVYEVMASMGIVGILCYLFYYAARFHVVLRKNNRKKLFPLFVLFTWIAFEGQSLVDMSTFEPVFVIIVTLQLAVLQNCCDEKYEQSINVLWLLPQAPSSEQNDVDAVQA